MVLSSRDFVSPIDLIATTTAFFDGHIDLDPASSDIANTIVQAERFFNWEHNGLLQEWKAKNIYLYPPRDTLLKAEQPRPTRLFTKNLQFKKSAQRVWLELAYQKWLRQEFDQGIVFLTSTEVALISMQKIGIDLPICILKEHPKIHEETKELKAVRNSKVFGFVLYLPSLLDQEESIKNFYNFYSTLGRVYVQ